MAQITWKNVNMPNIGGAVALQKMGQDSINQGLRGAAGIVAEFDKRETQEVNNQLSAELANADSVEDTERFISGLSGANLSDTTGYLNKAKEKGTQIETELELKQEQERKDLEAQFLDNLTGKLATAGDVTEYDAALKSVQNSGLNNKGKVTSDIIKERNLFVKDRYAEQITGTDTEAGLLELEKMAKEDKYLKNKNDVLKMFDTRKTEIKQAKENAYQEQQTNLMRSLDVGIDATLNQFYGNDIVRAREAFEEREDYKKLSPSNRDRAMEIFENRFDISRQLDKASSKELTKRKAVLTEERENAEFRLKEANKVLAAKYNVNVDLLAPKNIPDSEEAVFKGEFFNKDGEFTPKGTTAQAFQNRVGRPITEGEMRHILGSVDQSMWKSTEGEIEDAIDKYVVFMASNTQVGETVTPEAVAVNVSKYLEEYQKVRTSLLSDVSAKEQLHEQLELKVREERVLNPKSNKSVDAINGEMFAKKEGLDTGTKAKGKEFTPDDPTAEVKSDKEDLLTSEGKKVKYEAEKLENLSKEELRKLVEKENKRGMSDTAKDVAKFIANVGMAPTRTAIDFLKGVDVSMNKDLETKRVRDRLNNLNKSELKKLRNEFAEEDNREKQRLMNKLLKG